MMGAIQEALNKRKAKVSGSGKLYDSHPYVCFRFAFHSLLILF